MFVFIKWRFVWIIGEEEKERIEYKSNRENHRNFNSVSQNVKPNRLARKGCNDKFGAIEYINEEQRQKEKKNKRRNSHNNHLSCSFRGGGS